MEGEPEMNGNTLTHTGTRALQEIHYKVFSSQLMQQTNWYYHLPIMGSLCYWSIAGSRRTAWTLTSYQQHVRWFINFFFSLKLAFKLIATLIEIKLINIMPHTFKNQLTLAIGYMSMWKLTERYDAPVEAAAAGVSGPGVLLVEPWEDIYKIWHFLCMCVVLCPAVSAVYRINETNVLCIAS